ncbi:MAG: hypothetical protein GXO09_04355 [Crenarchaeota archaeon]|nr:hypothetical protein [Thermoproteota archaeon]
MQLLALGVPGHIRLHGAGDRLPRSPGPGAIPSEEPLLPRLETLLGALAAAWWARNPGGGCIDWVSCVLKPASGMLCYGCLEYVAAPLLVARLAGDENRVKVYIDVAAGLLDADYLDDYVEAARLLGLAGEVLDSHQRVLEAYKEYVERVEEAAEIKKKLWGRGLIPAARVLRRVTHISIGYGRRAVEHGLIYSLPWIDYLGAVSDAVGEAVRDVWVVLPYQCSSLPREGLDGDVLWLGVRHAAARVRVLGLEAGLAVDSHGASIVLSQQPLRGVESIGALRAVHPWRPRPSLESLASSYRPLGRLHAKTRQRPALWQGTVILKPEWPVVRGLFEGPEGWAAVLYRTLPVAAVKRLVREVRAVFASLVDDSSSC